MEDRPSEGYTEGRVLRYQEGGRNTEKDTHSDMKKTGGREAKLFLKTENGNPPLGIGVEAGR